jgi:hypothetical protein
MSPPCAAFSTLTALSPYERVKESLRSLENSLPSAKNSPWGLANSLPFRRRETASSVAAMAKNWFQIA